MSWSIRQSYMLGTSPGFSAPSVAPLILRDWKWHGQPQGPVGIDWSNPLTENLLHVVTPNVSSVPGAGIGYTSEGSVYTFNGAQRITLQNTKQAFPNGFTMFYVARRSVSSGIQSVVSRNYGSVAGGFESALYNLFGSPSNRIYSSQNGTNFTTGYVNGVSSSINGAVTTNAGEYYTVAGTIASVAASTYDIEIGYLAVGTRYLTGDVSIVALWDRQLSATEIASISANPWQLFKPRQQRIWVGV